MKKYESLVPFNEISAHQYDEERHRRLHRLEIVSKIVLELTMRTPAKPDIVPLFARGFVYIDEVKELKTNTDTFTNVIVVSKDVHNKPFESSLYIATHNFVVSNEDAEYELGYFGSAMNISDVDVFLHNVCHEQQLLLAA